MTICVKWVKNLHLLHRQRQSIAEADLGNAAPHRKGIPLSYQIGIGQQNLLRRNSCIPLWDLMGKLDHLSLIRQAAGWEAESQEQLQRHLTELRRSSVSIVSCINGLQTYRQPTRRFHEFSRL
jgi:hypothetical protein